MSNVPTWLSGLFAVLPTPMAADGALDLESLDRVVDYYLAGGASGLVPVSVAGEGDRLDEAERQAVIQRVVERSKGRAPVIAGVLDTDLEGALTQARMAAAWGIDALLVKPPMGPARAILDHFSEIGLSLRLPIVVLDHPADGPLLSLSLIRELVDGIPEICGIKLEEEPTAIKMAALRSLVGSRIRIFGGLGGAHCLEELEHGADGFFTGCPLPRLLVKAMENFRAGDRAAAEAACSALRHVVQRERAYPGAMIEQRKAVLRELGVVRETTVRPLATMRAKQTVRAA